LDPGEFRRECSRCSRLPEMLTMPPLRFSSLEFPATKSTRPGRGLIVKRRYPEYKHASGHVLGRSTHEIGPLLGPRWPNRYGRQGEKQVQRDMVFTIEPSVTSKFGTCNLEQDVLVTSRGYEELSKPQQELIRIG